MLVELKSVYKEYKSGSMPVSVLKDINLDVNKGDYIAIMGPSGSGKSTLMNIIGCLDVPTEGTYLLGGEDVSKLNDEKMALLRNKKIGFVFQTFNLLPKQTACENVMLPLIFAGVPRKERRRKAVMALEKVGLGDRVDFYPTQLSGGQMQRVAIARAIVTEPELLLADEPTGALDTASGIQIMEIFRELHEEGKTIIMITHDSDVAKNADIIMNIRDGKLGFEGTVI